MHFKKQNIAIVGSTGSVGQVCLKIISKYHNFFKVNLLVCNSSEKIITRQIIKYQPLYVFINNSKIRLKLKKKFKKVFFINSFFDLNKIYNSSHIIDKTIHAVSSISGMEYSFEIIKWSKEILVANKESIICGGKILLKEAFKNNCKITSIDSEHYCLKQSIKDINNPKDIKTIFLTASGGPFLNKSQKNISKAPIQKVISHPKWKMGKKISVDSANMINKINEVIEAHLLFDIPFDKIKIKIHPESIVHSIIVLNNGLVKIIAHDTTMEIPIRNSLFNDNYGLQKNNFIFKKNNILLSFDEVMLKNFLIIKISKKILNGGHVIWILFNVFNDFLVNKFLKKEIFFYQITSNLIKIFSSKFIRSMSRKKIKKLSDIYTIIKLGKKFIHNYEIN